MSGLGVRRLAAADMWGAAGTIRRRRLIRAEFVLGAIGCLVLGVIVLAADEGVWLLVGVWLVGVGVNYIPLALHAHALSRPGALEAELDGLDVRRELRWATVQQFWVVVPFAVAAAAAVEGLRR